MAAQQEHDVGRRVGADAGKGEKTALDLFVRQFVAAAR